MRAAIVSTQREWDDRASRWAEYHRLLGFCTIYIYCDASANTGRMPSPGIPGIVLLPGDPGHFDTSQSREAPANLIVRQLRNCRDAAIRAERDGIDWLLHIDDDELFWTPTTTVERHFSHVAAEGYDAVLYHNHEAVVGAAAGPGGDGELLFKRNPHALTARQQAVTGALLANKIYFGAYANGKCAVRLGAGLACGVHEPQVIAPRSLAPCRASQSGILHRPYTTLAAFIAKHRGQGAFPTDSIFGEAWLPSHLVTLAQDCVQRDDPIGLANLFHEHVCFTAAEIAALRIHDIVFSAGAVGRGVWSFSA